MTSVPAAARARAPVRRRATVAAVGLLGSATITFGLVRAFDGPATTIVDEVDGRTWLPTSGSDGPVLVLANGISGLVEGQVSGLDLDDGSLAFAGSDARHTLLRTPSQAVLLADGQQTAATLDTPDGAHSVLTAAGIVAVGDAVTLWRIGGEAAVTDPEELTLDGHPVPGTTPVVDAAGRAWVLMDRDDGGRHVQVVDPDGTGGDGHEAADAIGLLAVDGEVMLRSATAIRPVQGGDALAAPAASGVIPAVAAARGGAWAVADGSRLVVTGNDVATVDMAGPVTGLAVWHGRVWASTDDALVTVDGGKPSRVEGFRGRAQVFADGGRLWFVTPDVAAAIDRDQQVTVFTLTSVDLSLCVGDCSAGDVSRALDDLPTTTTRPPGDAAPPTTAPPISPPAQLPSLPTTTAATTSTTEAPPQTTPSTPPPTMTVAQTAPAVAPDPTVTIAATIAPVVETVPETIAITLPPIPPPSPPPPPRTSPPTNPPTDPPTTTTTEAPLPPGQLVLGVEGGPGRARVTYGFDGAGEQCAGADGDHTNGELSWAGVASGSELVELDLSGGGGRGTRELSDLPPGELTVTFRTCGEIGSAASVIEPDASRPSLGALTFDPAAPEAGQAVTVSATIDVPRGWLCAGATWVVDGVSAGSRCRGSSVSHELAGLTEGTHEVQVIVSFTRLIESTEGTASGSVTVTGTTTPDSSTSVPDTSSTSAPDSSTSVADSTTSIADSTTTIPDLTTTIGDSTTTIPDLTTTIGDSTTTVADSTTTVPPQPPA